MRLCWLPSIQKGGCYGWKPSSSSICSILVVRAYPLIEFRQTAPCRAIRGDGISVNGTLPPLLNTASAALRSRLGSSSCRRCGPRSRLHLSILNNGIRHFMVRNRSHHGFQDFENLFLRPDLGGCHSKRRRRDTVWNSIARAPCLIAALGLLAACAQSCTD